MIKYYLSYKIFFYYLNLITVIVIAIVIYTILCSVLLISDNAKFYVDSNIVFTTRDVNVVQLNDLDQENNLYRSPIYK